MDLSSALTSPSTRQNSRLLRLHEHKQSSGQEPELEQHQSNDSTNQQDREDNKTDHLDISKLIANYDPAGMNISSHTSEKLPFETRLNEVRTLLNIITRASQHKVFMETCMQIWIEPCIYKSNLSVEHKWKTILKPPRSLQLTGILISHYETVIAESCKQIYTQTISLTHSLV